MSISYQDVINLLARFANCFDLKDWNTMCGLLMDEVQCDYSSLRHYVQTISNRKYVNERIKSLTDLDTQHLFFNFDVEIKVEQADCQLNAMILRRNSQEYTIKYSILMQCIILSLIYLVKVS
jgi:hypothetical protein